MKERFEEKITIGVPTRNRPFYLAALLSSLLSQTFTEWDLIIVNDGDGKLEEIHLLKGIFNIIEHKGHALKIIPGPKRGPGPAHNVILSNSLTELILRVDDDVYLDSDYIEILYKFIISEENIGAVGGRFLNANRPKTQSNQPSGEYEEWKGKIVFKDGHFIPYECQSCFKSGEKPYEADHLYANFLYRKTAVDRVGGFPDFYSQMGRREETDTTLRMRMAGYRLFVLPQAIAWHIHSPFGGTRDGIDESNYQEYLQMEEDDVRLFENRMWKWIENGFREKIKIIIPDEFIKLRRLRYLLHKHKKAIAKIKSINLNEILEAVGLKQECLIPLTDSEIVYLLLYKILTTRERDEIVDGDRV